MAVKIIVATNKTEKCDILCISSEAAGETFMTLPKKSVAGCNENVTN